jgi:hypothetical protein
MIATIAGANVGSIHPDKDREPKNLMELKIGNRTFNQQALRNLFRLIFFTGIYVGIALDEDGKSTLSFSLFVPLMFILPKRIRRIKDKIQHEHIVADKS